VLANDSDGDSTSLTAVLVSNPAHGSVTLISDGYLTVRHPDKDQLFAIADWVGTDVRLYAA